MADGVRGRRGVAARQRVKHFTVWRARAARTRSTRWDAAHARLQPRCGHRSWIWRALPQAVGRDRPGRVRLSARGLGARRRRPATRHRRRRTAWPRRGGRGRRGRARALGPPVPGGRPGPPAGRRRRLRPGRARAGQPRRGASGGRHRTRPARRACTSTSPTRRSRRPSIGCWPSASPAPPRRP